MKLLLNSKFFENLSPRELGEKILDLGYDGIDICVRPGHPVNLDNVHQTLPEANRIWQDQGLVCSLATAPVSLIDPTDPAADRLYAACAEAGSCTEAATSEEEGYLCPSERRPGQLLRPLSL